MFHLPEIHLPQLLVDELLWPVHWPPACHLEVKEMTINPLSASVSHLSSSATPCTRWWVVPLVCLPISQDKLLYTGLVPCPWQGGSPWSWLLGSDYKLVLGKGSKIKKRYGKFH